MNRYYLATLIVGPIFMLSACTPAQQSQAPSQISPDQVPTTQEMGSSKTNSPAVLQYVEYTPDVFASNAQNTRVLFFHATWCPTCKAADTEISSGVDQLPQGVVVIKVDYDSQTDLKSKYNIVAQHTFVIIDQDGNEITKWVGGGLEDIIDRAQAT